MFKYFFFVFFVSVFSIFSFIYALCFILFFLIYLTFIFKKKLFIYLSAIVFSLLLFESYQKFLSLKNKINYRVISNLEYSKDRLIGYKPIEGAIYNEKIYDNEKLLLDVVYSIDNKGFRITGSNNKNYEKCVIFYGGSYTFGQSVNDEETLPFKFNEVTNEKFRVFNFGFNGYGPHQFLAYLLNYPNLEIFKCKSAVFVYQFLYDHVGRVAGKRFYSDYSPRFILVNDSLLRKGFFSDYPFKLKRKLMKNWNKLESFKTFYNFNSISKNDINLFKKLINKIEYSTKQKLNNSQFIYLIWDDKNILNNSLMLQEDYSMIDSFLLDKKNTFYVKEIFELMNYKGKVLNPIQGDNHPLPDTYSILASFLSAKLF